MNKKNIIIASVLLVVALLSFTVVSKYATSTEVHASSIALLDDKKVTAMELTAGVAATSTAISALPGDAATPIAEQVAELTSPLLFVICAIYLEKFLLTTIGFISFQVLIPIACVLGAIYLFTTKEALRTFAIKLAIFAVAISVAIPASVEVSKLIESTFEETINETYANADVVTEEAEKSNEENTNEKSNAFMEFLKGLGDDVSNLAENAKNALSVFIDAIAVLLITTCVIPILVIFFFLWVIKLIFGLNIDFSAARKWIPVKGRR